MNTDELEELEAKRELQLREQYGAALGAYRFRVQVGEQRIYLANQVDVEVFKAGDAAYFEVTLTDAWSWDPWRSVRTVPRVKVLTTVTASIEDLKVGG